MANIACGGHAGDSESMKETVHNCLVNEVSVGAHPSYPDRKNFGRYPMEISTQSLHTSLVEQVSNLSDVCQQEGSKVSYIKPHGALYNKALQDPETFANVISLAASFELPLVVLASPNSKALQAVAEESGVTLIFEAFADRRYTDDGLLVNRKYDHAVHNKLSDILTQSNDLAFKQGLISENNQWLEINAQTLCVHSDTPKAVEFIKAIRQQLGKS